MPIRQWPLEQAHSINGYIPKVGQRPCDLSRQSTAEAKSTNHHMARMMWLKVLHTYGYDIVGKR